MGLLARMLGIEQHQAMENALIADEYWRRSSLEEQISIAEEIISRLVAARYRSQADDVIEALDEMPRALQMQLVANALIERGKQEWGPGVRLTLLRNPFVAREWLKEHSVLSHAKYVSRKRSIASFWLPNYGNISFGVLAACADDEKCAAGQPQESLVTTTYHPLRSANGRETPAGFAISSAELKRVVMRQ